MPASLWFHVRPTRLDRAGHAGALVLHLEVAGASGRGAAARPARSARGAPVRRARDVEAVRRARGAAAARPMRIVRRPDAWRARRPTRIARLAPPVPDGARTRSAP